MNIQDCFPGLNVIHKTTGKTATIESLSVADARVTVSFENGTSAKVHPRDLDVQTADQSAPDPGAEKVPTRPCPSCAKRMAVTATTCPACGFTYSERQSTAFRRLAQLSSKMGRIILGKPTAVTGTEPEKQSSGIGKHLVVLVILAALAFLAWKFLLHHD